MCCDCCSVTVAAPRCVPSRMRCNSGERDVVEDVYRHHQVARADLSVFQCSHSALCNDLGCQVFGSNFSLFL